MSPRALLSLVLLAPLAQAGCATTHGARTSSTETELSEIPPEPRAAEPREVAKLEPTRSAKQVRRSTGEITRAELVAVLDGTPGKFLSQVDLDPRLVGGRFTGWRLASFFPGDERFAGVDLQAGDVVLNVNGQPIERPEQLMRVWDSLRTGKSLVVAIERDGQPRQLRYEIAIEVHSVPMIPYEELAAALEGNANPSAATGSAEHGHAQTEDVTLSGREQETSGELDVDLIDEGS